MCEEVVDCPVCQGGSFMSDGTLCENCQGGDVVPRRVIMNVKQIIINYLKANGFDGLCTENCGCGIDELVCCDEDCSQCEPAYKRTITTEDDKSLIGDFGIGATIYTTEKPKKQDGNENEA